MCGINLIANLSKPEHCSELNYAMVERGANLPEAAESGITYYCAAGVRVAAVCGFGDIRRLGAQFEAESLVDAEVSEQAGIHLYHSRSAEPGYPARNIADGIGAQIGNESRWIEPVETTVRIELRSGLNVFRLFGDEGRLRGSRRIDRVSALTDRERRAGHRRKDAVQLPSADQSVDRSARALQAMSGTER